MAATKHGHHIPGTPVEDFEKDLPKARCGGPRLCRLCATRIEAEPPTDG